jgi:hypothetical protein
MTKFNYYKSEFKQSKNFSIPGNFERQLSQKCLKFSKIAQLILFKGNTLAFSETIKDQF